MKEGRSESDLYDMEKSVEGYTLNLSSKAAYVRTVLIIVQSLGWRKQ